MSSASDIPVASEPVSEVVQGQGSVQAVASVDDILVAFKEAKERIASLEKMVKTTLRSLAAASKESAGASKKQQKRGGSFPKGETPPQVAAWNQKVSAALEDMKTNGWEAFSSKGKQYAPSVQEDGKFVFEDTKRSPTYKDAMSYASSRKESRRNSDASLESVAVVAVPEIKGDVKVVNIQEKGQAKADEKAAKEKARADEKAAKEKARADKKAAKSKPESAPVETVEPVENAVVVSETNNEEESEIEAEEWVFRGVKYFRTNANECWFAAEDGDGLGEWAGVYDPVKDKIDNSVANPHA